MAQKVNFVFALRQILQKFHRKRIGSLGIAVVKGKYGGVLVVEPPKHPHIPLFSQEIPKDPANLIDGETV